MEAIKLVKEALPWPMLYLPTAVGLLWLLSFTRWITLQLRFSFHRSQLERYKHSSKTLSNKTANERPWALVTGASDGVGKAVAGQLASKGFNVILHGRNEAKLNAVVAELKRECPSVSFKLLILDACSYIEKEFDRVVLDCVSGLQLTVVVHNAGGQSHLAPKQLVLLEEMTSKNIDDTINLNARFATQLTRVLLPALVRAQPALMLFVSSGASLLAVPYTSVYSGSKSYTNSFADCLQFEIDIKGYDIEVHSVIFGKVITKAVNMRDDERSFDVPLASEMAGAMLSKVGWKKEVLVVPWIGHRPLQWIPSLLPRWVVRKMLVQVQEELKTRINLPDKEK